MNTRTAARVTPLREPDTAPQPPTNIEAEQALLGAIFVNPGMYQRVAETLFEEHFSHPVHGRIYRAIGQQIEGGAPAADPVTLRGFFEKDPALIDMGGARYLMDLLESAVSVANAPYYAETIVDCYRRRVLIDEGQDLVTRAYRFDADDSVDRQIEEAGGRLFDLSEIGISGRPRVTSGGEAAALALDAAQRAYREPGKLAGISSGIARLDRLVGGFAAGCLYIIGGRPGQGKTALVGSIVWAAAEAGYPTHFFSGEMSGPELTARLMAALSSVSASKQRRGDLLPSDWDALHAAQRRIAAWPLTIDDGPMALPRIRQQLRYGKRRQRTALAVVDYLQLVASGTDSESRLADVGRVSNGLKRAAKDLDIPIIACAQLSRGVEVRDDKRPMMSDLRYAGEIEQDADAIMLLYREEYYLSKAEPRQNPSEPDLKYQERHALWAHALDASRGKAEIGVAKNRHDREGVAHVRFDADRTYFHDPQDKQQGLF